MEKEKSPGDTRSTKSDTNSNETVVSSSKKAVSACQESTNAHNMGKHKTEYVRSRRKNECRTIWNPEKHSPTMQLMQRDLEMGLQHCVSGDEREVLNRTLRPLAHLLWYKIIPEVKSDLFSALCTSYPSVQLEVYGSTLIGIAFNDSHLDFYINLFPTSESNNTYHVIDGVSDLLLKSETFSKLPIFVSARSAIRSPIRSSIRLLHIKTGAIIRLNFFDRSGIINSPILAHLLTFDERIDFLATVIKWWMKVHHCYGPSRLTNYAVMWMLVFYLQSISIIPPILHFQMHVPEVLLNGFNFAFDYNYPNNTRNKQRCAELLLGFFKFYNRFDFKNLVICPLFGRAFVKADVDGQKLAEFAKYEALLKANPDKKPLHMKDCICIQDPFEITNSIPVQFAPKVFARFTDKIAVAAELIENELHQSGETTNLFLRLFDVDFFHQKADEKYLEKQCYLKF